MQPKLTREKRSVFAIGDIHGCLNELETLLSQLPLEKDSLLVFLGDYVDRGENSKGVIETLIQLSQRYEVVTLKGNHEAMFCDFLRDPKSQDAAFFIFNGGSATVSSYGNSLGEINIPVLHQKFLNNLKVYHEIPGFFFVHAGVPNLELQEIKSDLDKHQNQLLWIRSSFLDGRYTWDRTIVHGHTVTKQPVISQRRIGIDTGCVYGGNLTAVEVYSQTVFSVPRIKATEHRFLRDERSQRVAVRFPGTVPVQIQDFSFESVNYNNFGMLIRNDMLTCSILSEGKDISGEIRPRGKLPIPFKATVVRQYVEGGHLYCALKMIEPVFGSSRGT